MSAKYPHESLCLSISGEHRNCLPDSLPSVLKPPPSELKDFRQAYDFLDDMLPQPLPLLVYVLCLEYEVDDVSSDILPGLVNDARDI
mmetsp:Transcript_3462/g.5216  ORF Transcript_3462/g.5216 Transcript_3462/m.5216 type:complete len:87 (+) Transcript_3462:172-432(+)